MIIAQGFMMRFIPPPSPAMTRRGARKSIFVENAGRASAIGCTDPVHLLVVLGDWAIAITPSSAGWSAAARSLTCASIANVGGGYVFFLLIPMTWAVIAFRAGDARPGDRPDHERLGVVRLPVHLAAVRGLDGDHRVAAILRTTTCPTIYPRWVAYFNFWSALLIFPAGLIVFFKQGPFAYDGFVSFWFAFFVFFGWMVTMTTVTLRALRREKSRQQAEAGEYGAGRVRARARAGRRVSAGAAGPRGD